MTLPISVLILGSGELGAAVLRGFAAKPESKVSITVLLRPATAARPRDDPKVAPIYALPRPIKILSCDLLASSRSELATKFSKYDVVVGCTGYDQNSAGTGTGLQMKIAKAIYEAGSVKLYIPWQFGVDYDLFEHGTAGGLFSEQKDVREYLREMTARPETKTKWTIISTGIFMSFLFSDFWGIVQRTGDGFTVNALASWETTTTVSTPEDIGNLTAEIVLAAMKEGRTSQRLHNTAVFIASDTLSYEEIFELLKETTKKPVEKGEVQWIENLESRIKDDDILTKYRVAFGRGTGVAWKMETTFNAEHDIPMQNAKSWLGKNLN